MKQRIQSYKAVLLERLEPLLSRYHKLTKREQVAVLGLSGVFIVFCLYWLIWSPVQNARTEAKNQYLSQQQIYNWIHEHEDVIKDYNRSGAQQNQSSQVSGQDENVLSLANTAADKHKVTMRSFSPDGPDKLRFQMEQQPFQQVMKWLNELANNYGVEVYSIDISAGNKPGNVNVRANLVRDS